MSSKPNIGLEFAYLITGQSALIYMSKYLDSIFEMACTAGQLNDVEDVTHLPHHTFRRSRKFPTVL